jgi:muramidase (phage lysozyme)
VTRDDILHAIQDPNLLAFLHVIREGETNQTDDAYRELFGGELFDYFGDHPRKLITKTLGGKEITSSAAGAYQFIRSTWDGLVRQYGFKDFSPINQDLGAVALIAEKKALPLITEGRIREAIARCASVWASLPGSQYGQPTQKLEKALAVYREYGGSLVAEAPSSPAVPASTKEVTMAPLIIPILSAISSIIPALGKLGFGSGSEVAQRNVAAGAMVAEKIVEVTNSVNLQEAAEKVQSDPAALAAAKAAVQEVIALVEVGDGGIGAARKTATDPAQIPFYKNPAFIIAALLTPLIYMVAVEILFNPSGQTWSDDIKMMFVTAIVSGLLGSVTGFFLGSSLGSQKKDAALGAR